MEWSDEGVILGVRRHGEGSVIVEAMTRGHGRHLGLVRGGRSARMRPLLQAGNTVALTWRARLDEHLGNYSVDAEALRAAGLMQSSLALHGLQTLAGHLRLLPERDPHGALFEAANVLLDHLDEAAKAARLMVRLELALLEELGFGLELTVCALTGVRSHLAWVSPRSGKAASRQAAAQWSDRLLALPAFLCREPDEAQTQTSQGDQIAQAFGLTGHFLGLHVWAPRGLRPSDERGKFIALIDSALRVN